MRRQGLASGLSLEQGCPQHRAPRGSWTRRCWSLCIPKAPPSPGRVLGASLVSSLLPKHQLRQGRGFVPADKQVTCSRPPPYRSPRTPHLQPGVGLAGAGAGTWGPKRPAAPGADCPADLSGRGARGQRPASQALLPDPPCLLTCGSSPSLSCSPRGPGGGKSSPRPSGGSFRTRPQAHRQGRGRGWFAPLSMDAELRPLPGLLAPSLRSRVHPPCGPRR